MEGWKEVINEAGRWRVSRREGEREGREDLSDGGPYTEHNVVKLI